MNEISEKLVICKFIKLVRLVGSWLIFCHKLKIHFSIYAFESDENRRNCKCDEDFMLIFFVVVLFRFRWFEFHHPSVGRLGLFVRSIKGTLQRKCVIENGLLVVIQLVAFFTKVKHN